jgi:hypothetical protein
MPKHRLAPRKWTLTRAMSELPERGDLDKHKNRAEMFILARVSLPVTKQASIFPYAHTLSVKLLTGHNRVIGSMIIRKPQAPLAKFSTICGKGWHQSSSSGVSGLMIMAWAGGIRRS